MADRDDDEPVAQTAPKRKRKKRKKSEENFFLYYLTFVSFIFTLKNALAVVLILAGMGLTGLGFHFMKEGGPIGVPWLVSGVFLILFALALRFFIFPE